MGAEGFQALWERAGFAAGSMGAALSTARCARGFHADPPADRGLFFSLLAAPRLSVNRILSQSNW